MSTDLKQDLINKILATEDENLLMLLKTEYDFFTGGENIDVINTLSTFDKGELISMVNEPFGLDTLNQKEFDEAINQWRTK